MIPTAQRSRTAWLVATVALAVASIGLLAPQVACAAAPTPTITAVSEGHWNDPNTWLPKRVPNGADDVLIATGVLLDPSAVSVHSLQFRGNDNVKETGVLGPWSVAVGLGGLWVSTANESELNILFVPTTVSGPASIAGTFENEPLTLEGTSTITGTANVIVNRGSLELIGQIGGEGTKPSVNAAGATITLRGRINTMTNAGAIDVPAGATPEFYGGITNEAGGHIDVAAAADLSDPLAENRCHTCSPIVLNGGELTGTGTVEAGVANVGGTVSPGGDGAIGQLTIADWATGYRQSAGGTLHLDVRGTAAGTSMDRLVIGGAAQLGGSLYVDSSGYAPGGGVDHPVVGVFSGNALREGLPISASTSGTFASVAGPGAASFEALYPAVAAPSCFEPATCTGVDLRSTAVTAGGSGGGGGGSTGGGGGAGAGPPVGGPGAGVAAALAAIVGAAVPRGKLATIKAVLAHNGYAATFTAPAGGSVSIGWYQVPSGAHLAAKKPVLVASGTAKFPVAGTRRVTLKLTAAGRSLLKRSGRLKLVARAIFAPTGGARSSATRGFTLRH